MLKEIWDELTGNWKPHEVSLHNLKRTKQKFKN